MHLQELLSGLLLNGQMKTAHVVLPQVLLCAPLLLCAEAGPAGAGQPRPGALDVSHLQPWAVRSPGRAPTCSTSFLPDLHARQPCLFPVTPACTWQRICEDVRNYVNASVMLTISVMRKLLNCLAFTGVLCQ